MQDPAVSKYTVPFGLSLAICAVLNALLVIAKEKSKSVVDWMQKITGHHWITHVAIVLIAFLVLGFALTRSHKASETQMSADRLGKIVIGGVAAGILIIGGFYLIAG